MITTRCLAAILAADVAGYSRLVGLDEEGTLNRLKALRADLIDPKIAEHHGRIVKTTGDGILIEFASVVAAARCAIAMQRGMEVRNSEVLEERRIIFRVGINLGDIVVDGEDILGDGVNIAARLEGIAQPGNIRHLDEMNRALANELQQPIGFGIGIHAGEVIIGTMGYREHAQTTVIGEAVHIASRLQDLTKEYRCQLVVSEAVGTVAGVPLGAFPRHDIQVRGLSAPLAIRVIDSAARLAHYEPPHLTSETEQGGDQTDRSAPACEQSV
jgi:class 3 adenylate cyclase